MIYAFNPSNEQVTKEGNLLEHSLCDAFVVTITSCSKNLPLINKMAVTINNVLQQSNDVLCNTNTREII